MARVLNIKQSCVVVALSLIGGMVGGLTVVVPVLAQDQSTPVPPTINQTKPETTEPVSGSTTNSIQTSEPVTEPTEPISPVEPIGQSKPQPESVPAGQVQTNTSVIGWW